MKAKKSSLASRKHGAQKDEGATTEEALEAINAYYEDVSDEQFAEDVRNACISGREGSNKSSPLADDEQSGQ